MGRRDEEVELRRLESGPVSIVVDLEAALDRAEDDGVAGFHGNRATGSKADAVDEGPVHRADILDHAERTVRFAFDSGMTAGN